MQTLISDTRHALRSLWKTRGFSAVALLTIALGVGANSAVFSVVNAVLLRPLPYRDADRLVWIRETARRATVEDRSVSYPNFLDWQREARAVRAMAANSGANFTLLVGDTPERLPGEVVSWTYLGVLGVKPALGRDFEAADDRQGSAAVVVISDGLWERAFGRDPAAVGRAVRIDEELATVVGIMPPGFAGFSDAAQLWMPIGRLNADALGERGDRWLDGVVARLAPTATLPQAAAELDAIARRLEEAHPKENRDRGIALRPLRDALVGPIGPMLLVLLGAVGFVLLIACANVASLLLARGTARQRELALRSALGARRSRVIRQLLTESVTLSLLGGVAGLIVAFWSIDLLVALSPVSLPSFVRIHLDATVLAVTFALCLAAGILFGLAPAVAASRTDIITTLKAGGRGTDGAEAARLRRGLVTAEIALAVVLLTGAGLMLRTLDRIRALDPGFRPTGLFSLRVALPEAATPEEALTAPERRAAFARALLDRVEQLPGIVDASLSSDVPMGSSYSATMARIEGHADGVRIYRHLVSPGYFRTLGVPLLEGRDFTPADGRGADVRVAIVSRTMARRFWPDRSPLHQWLRIGERAYEIVAVVGNVKHRELLESDTADPDVYFPLLQLPAQAFSVMARTEGALDPAIGAVRAAVRELDASVPIFAVQAGSELLAQQTSRERFGAALLGAFGVVALALTMVGIYGVTAYAVSRQTRQVGIRMALGATRADVLRLVMSAGLTFIVAGIALGTAAAFALTRLLESFIYGVSATDPLTFTAAAVLLAVVALLACFIPAARATRIDPVVALRSE
jgi:predicted permease